MRVRQALLDQRWRSLWRGFRGPLLALCLFGIFLCFYLLWLEMTGRVYPNVTVGGVAAGGLARQALSDRLDDWLTALGAGSGGSLTGRAVVFTDQVSGRSWTYLGADLGLAVDTRATVDRACAEGRGRTVFGALAGLVRCSVAGSRVAPSVVVDQARLGEVLCGIAGEVETVPVSVSLDPRTGEVRPGRPGRLLDQGRTVEALRAAAESLGQAGPGGTGPLLVPLALAEIPPRGDPVRLAFLDRERLGWYRTAYDPTETGRAWNISLACARLDGTVIEPGRAASFNGLVGARTAVAGFREAPEIVGHELVPGLGGGVCQVASTLFNAALLADLDVAERYHHSRPLGYVPLGRDATVSYPTLDLIVRNRRAFPVILTAWARDGQLEVGFWGHRTLEGEVSLETEELNLKAATSVIEVRADLPAGTRLVVKEPFDGRDVRLWRVVRQAGQVVRRELIWVDHYEPIAGLVQTGPPLPAGGRVAGPAPLDLAAGVPLDGRADSLGAGRPSPFRPR